MCPHRLDRRTPCRRDPVGQSGEAVGRAFVVVAGRFAHHRNFGVGAPVFETLLAIGDLIARDPHRAATGEFERFRFTAFTALRRRRKRGDDQLSHGAYPDTAGAANATDATATLPTPATHSEILQGGGEPARPDSCRAFSRHSSLSCI